MMKFSWNKVSAYQFQDLCIHLANKEFAGKSFVNYLKNGQKQHGIDLYDASSSEAHICIQCKKYDDGITTTQLKEAVKDFVTNDFSEKTGTFILATTAALHKAKERAYLEKQKVLFREQYGITFFWWDISILEDLLETQKAVVQKYFGKYEADEYCLPQLNREAIPDFKEADDYIPRVIVRYSGKESNYWHRQDETLRLADLLLTGDQQNPKKVCLVGDPYNGKSCYLGHTAYLFQKVHGKKPLLLQVKEYNIQSIEDLLTVKYGFWQEIPFTELVVMIDGLDEAPAPLFDECSKYIDQFIKAYPSVAVVFSCRKFFYDEHSLPELIQGFESFELYPLQLPGIIRYLRGRLRDLFEDFWKKIEEYNLETILYYPFYLTFLADLFLNGERFPTTRIEVLKQFIEHECSSSTRRVADGRTVSKQKEDSYRVLRKFAFALQLAGLNSFSFSEIKTLFNKEERELLEQISLITTEEKRWCFINALFQEHLAAMQLAELPVEQILSLVSVGQRVKKIKTKWAQSYCSLLSFVDHNEKFQQLVDFLRQDNPELIFKTERTKFLLQTRELFFRELMKRCIALDTRFFTVYETDVAHFLEDSEDSVEYLICLLSDASISYTIKVMCTRVLQQFEIGEHQKVTLLSCVETELQTTDNAGYARYLLELIAKNKLGSQELLERWMNSPLNEHHEFRDGMYQVITSLNLVERYYAYGLEGLAVLAKHNQVLSHGGSEFQLERFLLTTSNRFLIAKLISVILSPRFTDRNRFKMESFHKKVSDKLMELFTHNPLVVFQIVTLLRAVETRHLEEERHFITSAVSKAGANGLLLRVLLSSEEDPDVKWKYGELVSPDCFDQILFEYEDDRLDMGDLQALALGMRMVLHPSSSDFAKLCEEATEYRIWPKAESDDPYTRHQRIKQANDMRYLHSMKAFKKGVASFFKAFGKQVMHVDDLYVDEHAMPRRVAADSDVIYLFLQHRVDRKKMVRLSDLKTFFQDEKEYEYYRAAFIADRYGSKKDCDESLLAIVKNYYYQNLPMADFTNALSPAGGFEMFKPVETLLGDIFLKFQFDTDAGYLTEMIWLDAGGTRDLSHGESTYYKDNRNSLIRLILSKLNEVEKRILRRKVVGNMKLGIKLDGVLGTHVSLCDHLHIEEAKGLIFDIIRDKKLGVYEIPYCTEVYKRLDGDLTKLTGVFKDMTDPESYSYLRMAAMIKDVNKEAVTVSLLTTLRNDNSSAEAKLGAAKILATLGIMEGFSYLTERVRISKQAPYTIQGGVAVYCVDTAGALLQLRDIAYLIIAPEYERSTSFADSAKHILLEWLDGFASKSEDDLLQVDAFFEEAGDRLQTEYRKTASHFNWYRIRVMEHFRSSDKHDKSIRQIKQILREIETDEFEN